MSLLTKAKRPKKANLSRRQRRNIKRWVKALRSGDFAQVNGDLKAEIWSEDEEVDKPQGWGFCCLGVLCEVTDQDLDDGYNANGLMIHPALLEHLTGLEQRDESEWWDDLDDRRKDIEETDGFLTGHLANLNDNGKSFKQIATIIERRAEAIHPGWDKGL